MKQLLCVILSFYIFSSCSNQKSSTKGNVQTQIDSLKQNFNSIFNGVWVLTDYITAIEQTKSPVKSSDILNGMVAMLIDGINNSDSIDVFASLNNHEGYNFTSYLTIGQSPNRIKTNIIDYEEGSNFYELGYEVISNETFLFLYHYDKSSKLLGKKQFSKVLETQFANGTELGIQYIVNKKLFAGNYLLIDNENNSTKINLKSDGTISGFSKFNKYFVSTDFCCGPNTIIDEIAFSKDDSNASNFAFEIKNDTTFIYSTITDIEADEFMRIDKIVYKLVRQ